MSAGTTLSFRRDNLALLYQGLFTATVRIQSGRQQIGHAESFRRRMRDALAEVNREALKVYSREHTIESDFAIVAFLDEVILSSDDPCRPDWAQKPLQEEMFGVSLAGEMFFSRLEALLARPDTAEIADVLEVYYLCLLLGFQGKYVIGGGAAELQLITDRVRQRMERIRGPRKELSPATQLPADTTPAARQDPIVRNLRIGALAALGFAVVCFLLFTAHLYWQGTSLSELLARSALL